MHAAPVQRTILSTRRIMVPPLTLCAYMKKGPNLRWSLIQCSGGDEGDRTPDLLTASQALSQLSYAPVRRSTIRELPRRCKDNFGKTFLGRRRGCGTDSRAMGPRCPTKSAGRAPREGGAAAALPSGSTPPAPGPPPRNRPIYYVWPASPDHGVSDRNKTAGRRPAVFVKYGVWSRSRA